jgi:dipeptidyl aminopeptidase/acylaminoacyl peptidase
MTNGDPELEGTLGEQRETSSVVHAIVSYFGASNLLTILDQSTPFGLGVRTPALERLLGALPKDAEAVAKRASPVFHVDASDPPLLLLHGDQDPQMPINQSHELEGAYKKVGLDVALIVVHGAAHGGDAFFDKERTDRVAAFLDEHLRRELTSDSAQR